MEDDSSFVRNYECEAVRRYESSHPQSLSATQRPGVGTIVTSPQIIGL